MKVQVLRYEATNEDQDLRAVFIPINKSFKFRAIDSNGKTVYLKALQDDTFAIIENGSLRFNKPVKFDTNG